MSNLNEHRGCLPSLVRIILGSNRGLPASETVRLVNPFPPELHALNVRPDWYGEQMTTSDFLLACSEYMRVYDHELGSGVFESRAGEIHYEMIRLNDYGPEALKKQDLQARAERLDKLSTFASFPYRALLIDGQPLKQKEKPGFSQDLTHYYIVREDLPFFSHISNGETPYNLVILPGDKDPYNLPYPVVNIGPVRIHPRMLIVAGNKEEQDVNFPILSPFRPGSTQEKQFCDTVADMCKFVFGAQDIRNEPQLRKYLVYYFSTLHSFLNEARDNALTKRRLQDDPEGFVSFYGFLADSCEFTALRLYKTSILDPAMQRAARDKGRRIQQRLSPPR